MKIRIKMTNSPKKLKNCGVSLTMSPVTQRADVDVKNASMNLMGFPPVAIGSESRNAPTLAIVKYPRIKSFAGLDLLNQTCILRVARNRMRDRLKVMEM